MSSSIALISHNSGERNWPVFAHCTWDTQAAGDSHSSFVNACMHGYRTRARGEMEAKTAWIRCRWILIRHASSPAACRPVSLLSPPLPCANASVVRNPRRLSFPMWFPATLHHDACKSHLYPARVDQAVRSQEDRLLSYL